MSAPIRIQVAVDATLVVDVVVEAHMADRTWCHYTLAKYRRGLPAGGALLQRADLPRYWNVPVGSVIPHASKQPPSEVESLA